MSLGRNICSILTVAAYIASILASPNCKNCLLGKCDEEGICTVGCEPGFADIYCQHPCQETCLKGRCTVDNYTGKTMCTEGCVDGFCYPACKIPCPEGCLRCERMLCENCTLCEGHLYGQSCQHSCVEKCDGYACSIEGNCSVDKCMDGRYGKFCSKSCKPRYESCDQESGHCLKCRRGLFGDDCQNHCSHECLLREEDIMFKCRSGCILCELPSPSDTEQDLACTEMKSQFNIVYVLIVAVMVIASTNIFLHIKNTWLLKTGLFKIAENIRKPWGTGSAVVDRSSRRRILETLGRVEEESGSTDVQRSSRRRILETLGRDHRISSSDSLNRSRTSVLSRPISLTSITSKCLSGRDAEEGDSLLGDPDADDEEQSQKTKEEADNQRPSQQMQETTHL